MVHETRAAIHSTVVRKYAPTYIYVYTSIYTHFASPVGAQHHHPRPEAQGAGHPPQGEFVFAGVREVHVGHIRHLAPGQKRNHATDRRQKAENVSKHIVVQDFRITSIAKHDIFRIKTFQSTSSFISFIQCLLRSSRLRELSLSCQGRVLKTAQQRGVR